MCKTRVLVDLGSGEGLSCFQDSALLLCPTEGCMAEGMKGPRTSPGFLCLLFFPLGVTF